MEKAPTLQFDRIHKHFTHDGLPIKFSDEDIVRMNSIRWWHEIPFASNLKTPAHHSPINLGLLDKFQIENFDFKGKSVLDIGAADGFYSFWAEANGASRIVGMDDLTQFVTGIASLEFARNKLFSKLEFQNLNIYELSPKNFGGFDVVMMFGVLYHLIHPLLGIERACSVCKSDFFLETHFINDGSPIPVCKLYPDNEYFNDYTNWSGPNLAWIIKALETQGFQTRGVREVTPERVTVHAIRVRNHHTESPVLNFHRDTTFFNLGEKVS